MIVFMYIRQREPAKIVSKEWKLTIVFLRGLNVVSPEGNVRSQREFIRSLALKNGYLIYFDRVSEEEMLLASQKSFLCDYEDMEKIIAKCIKKK